MLLFAWALTRMRKRWAFTASSRASPNILFKRTRWRAPLNATLGTLMKIVYLYSGTGKYAGTGSFEWNSPRLGDTHKFILFKAQEMDERHDIAAIHELNEYGFGEIVIGAGKPIAVESLNDPQMQVFQSHYEGALSNGSSLAWYP